MAYCRNCSCVYCLAARKDNRTQRRRDALFWVQSYKQMGLLPNSYRFSRIARAVGISDMPVRRCAAEDRTVGVVSRCTAVDGHGGWHSSHGHLNWR